MTGESVYEPEMVQELLITNAAALKRAEKAVEELQNEQNKLDVRLKEMASQYENIRDWAEIFDSADVDEKKMILARIIKKITVNRNYEITIHFFLALDDFKKAFKEEGEMNVKIREVESPEKVLA